MSETPAVEVRGLSFSYNGVSVLDDVNITVEQGEFVVILGPNGGGKTTLLKLMLGLLKPDAGSIRILGSTPVAARRRIGYVPQYSKHDRDFPVRVLDVVMMGLHGAGGFGRGGRERVEEALQQVGLQDLRRRSFTELSGGQQQRVLIARAMVSQPELLMMDEPTANLDITIERTLFDLMSRLGADMTLVTVTHDWTVVSATASRVLCVNRTVATHQTCEVTRANLEKLYGRDIRLVQHDRVESSEA